MVKIVIADGNDILYNSLSNISLQNELNFEIIEVPQYELEKIICKIKPKDNVIILDSITSITFIKNVLNNATEQIDIRKTNIIILVLNSNSISHTEYRHSHYFFKPNNTSIFDIVKIVSDSLKDTLQLGKSIDDLLWQLGFSTYFKGCIYLKEAIKLAFIDRKLLLDTKKLVNEVAKKHKIKNEKVVRSDMDKLLNNVLNLRDKNNLYEVFGKDYDGRIVSLKYFIDLSVRYLGKEKKYCLEN